MKLRAISKCHHFNIQYLLYIYTLLYYILHCVVNVNDVNNQQYNIIQREERTDACTKITI